MQPQNKNLTKIRLNFPLGVPSLGEVLSATIHSDSKYVIPFARHFVHPLGEVLSASNYTD